MSSRALRHAQTPLDALRAAQERLLKLRSEHLTWRQIAARSEYAGVSFATLCDLGHGIEPKSELVRLKLGLPTLIVMPKRRSCERCYRAFIPNVPWRKLCPICSPPETS